MNELTDLQTILKKISEKTHTFGILLTPLMRHSNSFNIKINELTKFLEQFGKVQYVNDPYNHVCDSIVVPDYSHLSYDEADVELPIMIRRAIAINQCPILAYGQSSVVLWQMLGQTPNDTASYIEGRHPAFIQYGGDKTHPYRTIIEELCIENPQHKQYLSGDFSYVNKDAKRPKFVTNFGSDYVFKKPNKVDGVTYHHLSTSNVNNTHYNDFIMQSDNNPLCIGTLHIPYNIVNLEDSINNAVLGAVRGDYSSILHIYKLLLS
jgi:hypothetical protein